VEHPLVIRVLTRCSSAEQFVAAFRRFSTDTSIFVPTADQRDVGTPVELSMRLADDTVVLAATGEIACCHATAESSFGKPGIEIAIRELTPDSKVIFEHMRAMPVAAPQDDDTAPIEVREQPSTATTPGVAPLVPAPHVPRFARSSTDPFERIAMVALDRESGRPTTTRLQALRGHVMKSVRGVRWWWRRSQLR
jgi:Tfp pilus assembly protein PilZ